MLPSKFPVIRFLEARRFNGIAIKMAKVLAIKARNKVSTILSIVRCKVSLTYNGALGPSHNGLNRLPIFTSTWGTVTSFWKLPVASVAKFPIGNSCSTSLTQNSVPLDFGFKRSPAMVMRSPICPEL